MFPTCMSHVPHMHVICSSHAGTELFAMLEPLKEKVVVIISADLAHTHMSTGPYGYSNASEPFDLVRTLSFVCLFLTNYNRL